MTSTYPSKPEPSNNQARSPYKAVPPNSSPPQPQPKAESQPEPSQSQPSSPSYRRWLIVGGVILGIGLIGQIPVPNSVKADAQLKPLPDSHRRVYMEVPGKIIEIAVEPNDRVRENQTVAIVSTDNLDGDINEAQARYEEVLSRFEATTEEINTYEAKSREAKVHSVATQGQMARLQGEIANLQALPEVQKLNSNIAALNAEIDGFKEEKSYLEGKIKKIQPLVAEGAVSEFRVDEFRQKRATFQRQINQRRQQIAAKRAEIDAIAKQKQDELEELRDRLSQQTASQEVAAQTLASAQVEANSQRPLLETRYKELERLQQEQQTHQLLKTETSGVVLSQNLHERVGQTMEAGEPVMEVADLSQLVAFINVPQADSDIVVDGAEVTFHPLEPGFEKYSARIQEVERVMQSDETKQKQLLRVRAEIDNSQEQLLPGAKVYATIKSERIPLYRKVYRELAKLFKFRRHV